MFECDGSKIFAFHTIICLFATILSVSHKTLLSKEAIVGIDVKYLHMQFSPCFGFSEYDIQSPTLSNDFAFIITT